MLKFNNPQEYIEIMQELFDAINDRFSQFPLNKEDFKQLIVLIITKCTLRPVLISDPSALERHLKKYFTSLSGEKLFKIVEYMKKRRIVDDSSVGQKGLKLLEYLIRSDD